MSRSPRPGRSCCSRSSASAMSEARPSLPPICRSRNGQVCLVRRTRRNTTVRERLLPGIRVIDAAHPLFGQRLVVSAAGASRRIGWIGVVLADGRHRWIPREATGLDDAACEAGPNRDLPPVSVRTLLPLAEYVRARLSSAREEVDGTSGPAADPAVRTGITGPLADPRPQGVVDDDAESTAAAGAGVGSAAPISSGRN
jgi:hypothetical protein